MTTRMIFDEYGNAQVLDWDELEFINEWGDPSWDVRKLIVLEYDDEGLPTGDAVELTDYLSSLFVRL